MGEEAGMGWVVGCWLWAVGYGLWVVVLWGMARRKEEVCFFFRWFGYPGWFSFWHVISYHIISSQSIS